MNEQREFFSDPANYRKMSEPHASADAANDAIKAFYDDVEAARKKHRIRDVVVAVKVATMYGDEEGTAVTGFSFGSSVETVGLAAYAYGKEQAALREEHNRLLAGKARRG